MTMSLTPRVLRRIAAVGGAALIAGPTLSIVPAQSLAAPTQQTVATPAMVPGAARLALPAAAVGRLAPSGCLRTGTSDACDLYAAAGTAHIVGSSGIPIWGFASSTPAPATSPGPNLVVMAGDTVTVTLHNQLPGTERMSLALPGIPAADFTAGLSVAATQTGVLPGATSTYTFTASRPGTFLYEAGHTAGGSRQAAMGLVGALVVLPGDSTAYGTPASTYDDESVMVLTEIDPALNADPSGFDMRSYRPAYRLINGNAFPEIPSVATDQGHRVLLRYVNAGSDQHPMALLGATQSAVGRDGHRLTFPESEVVAQLEPGMTEDTIVTMTTGPESKVTLFENGTHLDNNAQHAGDPLQTAFGGMMTVLDTNAPLPSTDSVGPVSSAISASPNPSTGQAPVTVTADLSDVTTGGSVVDSAELVIDDDAVSQAAGFGTAMVLGTSGVAVHAATGSITTAMMATMAAGRHVVYVRAHDTTGNWGVVGSVVFNLPKTGPATTGGAASPADSNQSAPITITATGDDSQSGGGVITNAEFFITDDATPLVPPTPTSGTGTAMTLNRSAAVVAETGKVLVTTVLAEGVHHAWAHSRNSLGLWGPLLDMPFTVDKTGPTVDGAAVGPNPTNGVVSDASNPGYLVVSAKVTDRDAGGSLQSLLSDAEAFLDPPNGPLPTPGTGLQLIPNDGALDSTSETIYGLIPLSQVRSLTDGTHHVVVRGKDAAGNWGAGFVADVLVDKTAPAIGPSVTASPNPTNGATLLTFSVPYSDASNTIGLSEFWLGATDPGTGRGTAVTVSLGTTGIATVQVPLGGVPVGAQTFHLRIQDKAGNWSNTVSATVTVVPATLFSDNFDSGGLTAGGWTRVNPGAVSVTAASNLPAPAAGRYGLQITYPTTAAPRSVAYISKTTGALLTSAHVDVDIKATGLATGAATPTILRALGPNGTTPFSLELRTQGAAKQVRLAMTLSGGATRYGAWVPLPSGAATVTLGWRAGPATGPAAGTLTLSFNHSATIASTVTGNTNALRANGIRLGVIQGVTNAVRGSIFFDNLAITR